MVEAASIVTIPLSKGFGVNIERCTSKGKKRINAYLEEKYENNHNSRQSSSKSHQTDNPSKLLCPDYHQGHRFSNCKKSKQLSHALVKEFFGRESIGITQQGTTLESADDKRASLFWRIQLNLVT